MRRSAEPTAPKKPGRPKRDKPTVEPADEFADAMIDLTAMERRFIYFSLTDPGGSPTSAARRAGYSHPDVEAVRLHKRPRVRAALKTGMRTAGLTCEQILSQLAEMATASMEDFITFDDDGNYRLDLAKAKKLGKLHLLKKVTPGRYGPTIELHDKAQILIQLGRWAGLSERTEVEVTEMGGRDSLAQKLEQLAIRLKGLAVPVGRQVALTGPGPNDDLGDVGRSE